MNIMKNFDLLRDFLSEEIHNTDNRDFDAKDAILQIYFDDMGFYTNSGEWADVQLLINVEYEKKPIYSTYEDRFGDSQSEVTGVTLEEVSRDIEVCSIKIDGYECKELQAYAEELLQEMEVTTKDELQEMECSTDDFSDFYDEEEKMYDDWYDQDREK